MASSWWQPGYKSSGPEAATALLAEPTKFSRHNPAQRAAYEKSLAEDNEKHAALVKEREFFEDSIKNFREIFYKLKNQNANKQNNFAVAEAKFHDFIQTIYADRFGKEITGMSFSEALNCAKLGRKISRDIWNKKVFVQGIFQSPLHEPYFFISNTYPPNFTPWLPDQIDLMAIDWRILD